MQNAVARRVVDKLSRSIAPRTSGSDHALADLLGRGAPAMICRLGSTELAAMRRLLILRRLRLELVAPVLLRGSVSSTMAKSAGVHPAESQMVVRVADRLLRDLAEADVIARWYNFMEGWVIRGSGSKAETMSLVELDPLAGARPWTSGLEGKRVLVIHPFASTIESQYRKRANLFPPGANILPDMALEVLPAVQSIGGFHPAHRDWFESLAVMEDAIRDSDAEIVLIGAGAYGLPLAAAAKRQGKVGIQVGGALQLLFGIRGARWDGNPDFERLATASWVRPSVSETPANAQQVEKGCYW